MTEQPGSPSDGRPGYFQESRSFTVSVLSILPLVAAYHVGVLRTGYAQRNMAELWLTGPLHMIGLEATHVVNVLLAVAALAVVWRAHRTGPLSLLIVAALVAEASFYAALLYKGGPVLAQLLHVRASRASFAISLGPIAPVALALGAGVYEELVFRLLLVGGGSWLLQRVWHWAAVPSLLVTLAFSSVLFAAAHHVGPLAEPVGGYTFLFRAVCGALLGLVFLARGFGVAVWAHAIYNALVMLQLAGQSG